MWRDEFIARPWDGNELPDGSRIILRTIRYDEGTLARFSGRTEFSAPVGLRSWRWNDNVPAHDYVMALDGAAHGAIFTVRTWPRGEGEYMPGNLPPRYQKICLQAPNQAWLTGDASLTLHASADEANARVFCLDLTHAPATWSHLYDLCYVYRQRAEIDPMLSSLGQRGTYGAGFVKPSPHPARSFMVQQGASESGFFEILVMRPG